MFVNHKILSSELITYFRESYELVVDAFVYVYLNVCVYEKNHLEANCVYQYLPLGERQLNMFPGDRYK